MTPHHLTDQTQAPRRATRRRRIRQIIAEWMRNPMLLMLPAAILVMGVTSDAAEMLGFVQVARSCELLAVGLVIALLLVLAASMRE